MTVSFQRTSTVEAEPMEVWTRVTSPAGINYELMPVLRMSVPAKLRGKAIHEMPIGQKIGRSWLFLFGLIPIDCDQITLAEREEGRRFLERSTMLSMSAWEHERTLVAAEHGTEVTDRIRFRLRAPLGWVPGADAVLGKGLHWLFGHRHRRLVRWFRRQDAS